MNPIEQYRTDEGLTCEALARLIGVSKATISRHCRDYPIDGNTAILYSAKLGIPLEVLRPDLPSPVVSPALEASSRDDPIAEPTPPAEASNRQTHAGM